MRAQATKRGERSAQRTRMSRHPESSNGINLPNRTLATSLAPGLQRSLLDKDENSIKKAPLVPQKQHRPECKALIPLGIESGIGMN